MKKTNIQMLLGVNYPRFTEYLEWLLNHKLVEQVKDDDGAERIALSMQGVEAYHRLVDWIKETMQGIQL